MMDQQYLTVKQFASRAGCTTQRVYQLLPKRLQPFLKTENGVKYIHEDGLQVVMQARVAQGFDKTLQPSTPPPEVQEPAAPSPELVLLRETVAALTAQLDAKDQQLASLTEALTVAQRTQQQLSDALAAAQALHAGTIQMQQQKAQQTQPEPPQDASVVDAAPEQGGEDIGAMVKEVQEKPLKRGFWAKLFGRKK